MGKPRDQDRLAGGWHTDIGGFGIVWLSLRALDAQALDAGAPNRAAIPMADADGSRVRHRRSFTRSGRNSVSNRDDAAPQRLEEARRKQAKDAELETRATELQNLRQALHTEVAMTASQCLKTLNDFTRTDSTTKNPRSALMPRLVIYEQNTGKIGLLSRDEIVNLIRFSGELYDLSVVANALIRRQMAGPRVTGDVLLLQRMLADACRYAADFMESVHHIPDADEDRPFIVRLREAAHRVNPGPT